MKRHATIVCLGLLVMTAFFQGCSKDKAPEVAGTADQAVLLITDGLADGRPQVVWYALPESYQKDVTELVHEFGANMDAELWNRSFGVVQKLTRVLDEKRDFILDHPMLTAQIQDRGEAEDVWDDVVGMLEVVADSEIADLDRVKKLDVERFLSGTGAEVFERFKKLEEFAPAQANPGSLFGLANAEAELISSEGDKARVRVKIPGQPPTEDDYVRVEGKWIPAEMAAEWDQTIAEARTQLAGLSGEKMQQGKQAALMQLTMVEGALDQLLETKTAGDFQMAVGGLMGMAMGAMMAQAETTSSFNPFGNSEPSSGMSQGLSPSPSPAPDFDSIPDIIDRAPKGSGAQVYKGGGLSRYLGEEVRISERGGGQASGVLISVSDDVVVIEKRFTGGSMTVEVNPKWIESYEPI